MVIILLPYLIQSFLDMPKDVAVSTPSQIPKPGSQKPGSQRPESQKPEVTKKPGRITSQKGKIFHHFSD